MGAVSPLAVPRHAEIIHPRRNSRDESFREKKNGSSDKSFREGSEAVRAKSMRRLWRERSSIFPNHIDARAGSVCRRFLWVSQSSRVEEARGQGQVSRTVFKICRDATSLCLHSVWHGSPAVHLHFLLSSRRKRCGESWRQKEGRTECGTDNLWSGKRRVF